LVGTFTLADAGTNDGAANVDPVIISTGSIIAAVSPILLDVFIFLLPLLFIMLQF
jgi:hypothetical protein